MNLIQRAIVAAVERVNEASSKLNRGLVTIQQGDIRGGLNAVHEAMMEQGDVVKKLEELANEAVESVLPPARRSKR